jgi:hypothetical protein
MSKLVQEYKGPGVLGLREQAEVMDDILRHRLDTVLPMAMREAGLDMWLIICHEDNYDPVFKTMIPYENYWTPILQIVVLYDRGKRRGIERLNINFAGISNMEQVWRLDSKDDQWATLRKIVKERDPKKIGINMSDVIWAAGGLSASLRDKLVKTLGARLSKRLVSAETACIRWLETRTQHELDLYETVAAVAHGIIKSCFSRKAITPGVTTCQDLRWRFWQTASDLGVALSFQPYFSRIRSKKSMEYWGKGDTAIRHGDMLHCDVGIEYLRILTDNQRLAYVLQPGEIEPPQGLRDGVAWTNKLQDVCVGVWGASCGLSGNEILKRSLKQAHREGIPFPRVYSHSLSHYLHEPGPLIGLPWEQKNTGGRGDVVLNYNTCYTMELCTRSAVPEWDGQEVTFGLEQPVSFTEKGIHFIDGRQTRYYLI